MAWFKVDDQSAFNPKVMRAGNAAFGAWVRLGAYCNAQLTDGFIPEDTATLIASRKELEAVITAGMLRAVDGGYEIHDYLKYQPSKASVLEKRELNKNRVKSIRERSKYKPSGNRDVTDYETRSNFPLIRTGSGTGSEVASGSDPMRARVTAAWRAQTGNLMADPVAHAEMVDLVVAAVADDETHMPEAYIAAFVAWVRSCEQGKRPQLAPRKFVEHFAAVQEWVRGERGPAKTGAAAKSGWREPMEHQAEAVDETDKF